MKTAVAETSIDCYHDPDIQETHTKLREQILAAMDIHCSYTRREIADMVDIDYSCASGRVKELIEGGDLIEVGTAPQGHKGRMVGLVRRSPFTKE